MPRANRYFLLGYVWHTHRWHHNNHYSLLILEAELAHDPRDVFIAFSWRRLRQTLEESGFSNRQRASFRACSALRFFSQCTSRAVFVAWFSSSILPASHAPISRVKRCRGTVRMLSRFATQGTGNPCRRPRITSIGS